MPTFNYIALNAQGARQAGSCEAADSKHVAAVLRGKGLFAVKVQAADGRGRPERGATGLWRSLSAGISARELAGFTRQLGTLVRAGLPLVRGLEVLRRQERNRRLGEVIATLSHAIRAGSTLSDAMRAHPRVFDRLAINMVRAGEAGGALDVVLERLARFQEKSLQLRGRVQAALMYPAIVLAVALAILAGLLVLVVPKFQQIFADLLKGAPLPPLTRAVLTLSEFVQQHFVGVAVGLVAATIGLNLLRGTTWGRRAGDTLVLKLPGFGGLLRRAVLARFTRTLGTLLASGVPMLPALLIARDTCTNVRIAAAVAEVHDRVREGAPVARSLEGTGVFPPLVTSMVEVGEQSGQLPAMLGKVADIYEEEVDNAMAGLSSLLEPLLILFLALVVGTIVIALFLPIIRIVQAMT